MSQNSMTARAARPSGETVPELLGVLADQARACQDAFDRAHRTIRSLNATAAGPAGGPWDVTVGADAVRERLSRTLAATRREAVLVMLGARPWPAGDVDLLRGLWTAASPRARFRLVYGPRREPAIRHGLRAFTMQARTGFDGWLSGDFLVVDGATTVFMVGDVPAGHTLITTQLGSVARMMSDIFEFLWMSSAPPGSGTRLRVIRQNGDILDRVVATLATGGKDETMARELGISLRTFRRHVAEILRRTGATSRFQAGVLAVRHGLVPLQPPAVSDPDQPVSPPSRGAACRG